MRDERVIDYMPVTMVVDLDRIPDGWVLCNDHAVCNCSGYTGALIRNKQRGNYVVYSCGSMASIGQRFAAKVDQRIKEG